MAKITRYSNKTPTLLLRSHHFVPHLSRACPALVQHLRQARLFVRVNVGSWVSLKVHVSNVRPIYVRIELRG